MSKLKDVSMWTLIGLAGVAYVWYRYRLVRNVSDASKEWQRADTSASVVEPSGEMQLYGIEKPPNWY